MTTESQLIPTEGVVFPIDAPPLDILAATVSSPLLPTIAIFGVAWRIIAHMDVKLDRMDDKIDSVRKELSDQIQAHCLAPRAALDVPPPL